MTRMRLTGLLRLVSLLIALIGVTLTISAPAAAAARTDLSSSDALYPRLVRLSHNADTAKNGAVIASVTTFPSGGGSGQAGGGAQQPAAGDRGRSAVVGDRVHGEAFQRRGGAVGSRLRGVGARLGLG